MDQKRIWVLLSCKLAVETGRIFPLYMQRRSNNEMLCHSLISWVSLLILPGRFLVAAELKENSGEPVLAEHSEQDK